MGHEVVQVDTALYRPKNHSILVELALVNLSCALSKFQYALFVQGGVIKEPFQETPSVQDLDVQVEARARVLGEPSLLERLSRNLSKKVVALRVASKFV